MGQGATSAKDSASGTRDRAHQDTASVDKMLAGVFSSAFAVRARIAPVRYSAATDTVTIAVADQTRIATVSAMFRFLLHAGQVEFKPVTREELEKAQADFRELTEKVFPSTKPKGRQSIGGATSINVAAGRAADIGRSGLFKLGGGPLKQTVSLPGYAEMGPALLAAVSLLAQDRLRQSPEMPVVQARVRHSQLLAVRVGLGEAQTDAVVLAAWLSSLPGRADVLSRIPNPFHLDQILEPTQSGPLRTEARVLEVVRAYETLTSENPDDAHDVGATRRRLNAMVPGGDPDVIEPFLQIMMDEQFLASLERNAGSVLLADQAEQATAALAVPLAADGYHVETVPDIAGIHARVAASPPDVLILSASLPGGSVLGLCRELRRQAVTRHVPILVLTDNADNRQSAEFLRAGADDVLARSAGPELTLLKVERLMGHRAAFSDSDGVVGSLRDMELADMVQILGAGGRNVEIRLRRERREGRLYVREGAIIHAECGPIQGAPAFFELMRWREGSFVTLPCTRFPERTIHETVMGLLMESARQADERLDPEV